MLLQLTKHSIINLATLEHHQRRSNWNKLIKMESDVNTNNPQCYFKSEIGNLMAMIKLLVKIDGVIQIHLVWL